MKLPIIYNTSGYENVTELKLLEGIVDVYLPDFKYMDSTLSARYSRAKIIRLSQSRRFQRWSGSSRRL